MQWCVCENREWLLSRRMQGSRIDVPQSKPPPYLFFLPFRRSPMSASWYKSTHANTTAHLGTYGQVQSSGKLFNHIIVLVCLKCNMWVHLDSNVIKSKYFKNKIQSEFFTRQRKKYFNSENMSKYCTINDQKTSSTLCMKYCIDSV